MDITHILGPVDIVEARVVSRLEKWGDLFVVFPEGYEHRNGILRPTHGVDTKGLIGTNLVVHCGLVYVSDNGKSGESTRAIKAYTTDGKLVVDHAPQHENYGYARIFMFETPTL